MKSVLADKAAQLHVPLSAFAWFPFQQPPLRLLSGWVHRPQWIVVWHDDSSSPLLLSFGRLHNHVDETHEPVLPVTIVVIKKSCWSWAWSWSWSRVSNWRGISVVKAWPAFFVYIPFWWHRVVQFLFGSNLQSMLFCAWCDRQLLWKSKWEVPKQLVAGMKKRTMRAARERNNLWSRSNKSWQLMGLIPEICRVWNPVWEIYVAVTRVPCIPKVHTSMFHTSKIAPALASAGMFRTLERGFGLHHLPAANSTTLSASVVVAGQVAESWCFNHGEIISMILLRGCCQTQLKRKHNLMLCQDAQMERVKSHGCNKLPHKGGQLTGTFCAAGAITIISCACSC